MQKPKELKSLVLETSYTNEVDLIEKLLDLYSTAKGVKLLNFEKGVLVYYIKYGHSKKTKNSIKEDTGKSLSYLSVIDHNLKTKGFLVDDDRNKRKKRLSSDMKAFQTSFLKNNVRLYTLNFKKEK